MCARYWNLNVKVTCPGCGKRSLWNLQTHFMGDYGSYEHEYNLNEDIPELEGVSVVLDGRIDDFNGDCEECGRFFDVGAEIVKGKVKRVWVIREVISQTLPLKFK